MWTATLIMQQVEQGRLTLDTCPRGQLDGQPHGPLLQRQRVLREDQGHGGQHDVRAAGVTQHGVARPRQGRAQQLLLRPERQRLHRLGEQLLLQPPRLLQPPQLRQRQVGHRDRPGGQQPGVVSGPLGGLVDVEVEPIVQDGQGAQRRRPVTQQPPHDAVDDRFALQQAVLDEPGDGPHLRGKGLAQAVDLEEPRRERGEQRIGGRRPRVERA
ncbi:hypothetical protein ACWEPL_57220 [Nonomuraea sp. NPDC004186]